MARNCDAVVYSMMVRNLDGQPAVLVAFVGDAEVEVRVGREFRILKRAEWRALPPYDPVPQVSGDRTEHRPESA